jgi:hypothetical protein
MGIVLQRDVGSLGSLLRLSAAVAAVAGGAGDATTTTGAAIDRMGFSSGAMPMTLAAAIAYEATLQTGKTLAFGYAVQDSADGANWSDYQTGTSAVVATGATAASAVAGQLEVGVNLTSARRYFRFNHAPDLSATGTDTAQSRAVGFAAGFDRLPQ